MKTSRCSLGRCCAMSYDLMEVVVLVVEVSQELELWSVLRQTWLLW